MSFLICSASSYVFLFICFFLSFYHIFLYFVVFIIFFFFFFFFFSSRRRHTRYIGDWSSDVCSSDLIDRFPEMSLEPGRQRPVRTVLVAVGGDGDGRNVSAVFRASRTNLLDQPIAVIGRHRDVCHDRVREIGRASCRERVGTWELGES